MRSIIQRYKSLYAQLEELKYERGHLFIDYDLNVSTRKNFRLWLSTIHNNKYQNKSVVEDRGQELPAMIEKKSEAIAHYLKKIKDNKRAIKEVKKKLSNLL
jgi:hypothetical protein